MSERKINLEEILNKSVNHPYGVFDFGELTKEMILKVMKEACRQTLELAAENAIVIVHFDENDDLTDEFPSINKQSILNTINQVE